MIDRKQLFSFLLFLLTSSTVLAETAQCPANSSTFRYHSLKGSQIAISISIDHSIPYEFMVDTGSQTTTMDPRLAAELKLQPHGWTGMLVVNNYSRAELVKPKLVEAGPVAVRDLEIAVQALDQIQASDPWVRGILGEDFLGRFDLLIDYGRKIICLDQSKELEKQMRGDRVPMIEQADPDGDLDFAPPVLVAAHVPGNGKKGTVLRIDSGSNAPVLFENQLGSPLMLQPNDTSLGRVAGKGGPLTFAAMPSQWVKIGAHMTLPIAFQTPINAGRKTATTNEDGLLPTNLFKRVFISCADHFVIFDPR